MTAREFYLRDLSPAERVFLRITSMWLLLMPDRVMRG